MNTETLFDRETLLQAISATERDVASFFESLTPDEWIFRVGSAWTPAEHLDHINIAVSAVARGFGMSRLILRLRFGRARRASRSYDILRDDYRGRLAAGAGASGRFVPMRDGNVEQKSADPEQLLLRWHRVNQRLRTALSQWSEKDLDRIQMPHPILGKITAREMVFFTVYHGGHHVAAAQSRLSRFTGDTVA